MPGDQENREKHPAYGLISFSRITGGGMRLFGSSVDNQTAIRLRVIRAAREHDLHRDWYFSTGRDLIEVDLSAAQFATLLTTMNVGEGTPCTIRYLDGVKQPEIPAEKMEATRVLSSFEEKMKGIADGLKEHRTKLEEILSKKSVNMGDRDQIRGMLYKLFQEIESNIPFVLESFQESTEKTVVQAKAEVDAFMTTAIQHAGLQQLKLGDIKIGEREPAIDLKGEVHCVTTTPLEQTE